MTDQPVDQPVGEARDRREAGAARLLAEARGVEAVRLPAHGRTALVATLGEIDEEELRAHLRELIARAARMPLPTPPGTSRAERDDGVEFSRPTCPTSPRLWKWREIPLVEDEGKEEEMAEWKTLAALAAACGLFAAGGWILSSFPGVPDWLPVACYILALVAGGWDAAIDSWGELRRGIFDIHFLMLAAAVGSALLGAWGEGALLLFLFSSAGALEHFALHRTRREIHALFRAAPKTAVLRLDDGGEENVPVEGVQEGDRLVVRPGDLFPVDATVVTGETAADESNLTGEAEPVAKSTGDEVAGGTLNLWGAVDVQVLRPARQSALQRIIRLIREAQKSRAPSQRFTDKFGTGYTWAVLGATAVMFLVWWLVLDLPAFRGDPGQASAFYRAMTLLVVASPCALVLSIPSAILAAIAWGARHGILFRGGAALERLATVDSICLDKTGTLTTGEMEVVEVASWPTGHEEEVAALAVAMEAKSAHPMARAITTWGRQRGFGRREVDRFESLTGRGLRAEVGGARVLLGKRDLLAGGPLAERLERVPWPPAGHSEVWVVRDDLLGRLLLRDQIRPESGRVLRALEARGLAPLMLTGDRPEAARAVAAELGLPVGQVQAGLDPAAKVEAIHQLRRDGRTTAMVGDGVNDAPSLAAADVAIAMGGRGSDAALEQSDLVLMNDRIELVLHGLQLSRATKSVIRQNLFIALGTVVVMVGVTLAGSVPLSLGVLAHEGSTVLVCLNSLRLLFLRGEAL